MALARVPCDLRAVVRLNATHRLVSCLVYARYLRVAPKIGYLLGLKLIELRGGRWEGVSPLFSAYSTSYVANRSPWSRAITASRMLLMTL